MVWCWHGKYNFDAGFIQKKSPERTLEEVLAIYYPSKRGLTRVINQLDFENWSAESDCENNSAYNHLATLTVFEIIKENGSNFIPELFRTLRAHEYETTQMQTVYDVFKEITGKTMTDYIEKTKMAM